MLNHLQTANAHLNEIIRLINLALADLKQGRKDELMQINEQVKSYIAEFINSKKILDNELLELASKSPEASLSELLSEAEQDELKFLRINLNTLYTKNTEYAKIIMSLKDFYDDLVNATLGLDDNYSEYFKK